MLRRALSMLLALALVIGIIPITSNAKSEFTNELGDVEIPYTVEKDGGKTYKVYSVKDMIKFAEETTEYKSNSERFSLMGGEPNPSENPLDKITITVVPEADMATLIYNGGFPADGINVNLLDEGQELPAPKVGEVKVTEWNKAFKFKATEGFNPNMNVQKANFKVEDKFNINVRFSKTYASGANKYNFVFKVRPLMNSAYQPLWYDLNDSNRPSNVRIEFDANGANAKHKLPTDQGIYAFRNDAVGSEFYIDGINEATDKPYGTVKLSNDDFDQASGINTGILEISNKGMVKDVSIKINGEVKGKIQGQNSTEYFYNITGDWNKIFLIRMRQVLNVKLNSAVGKVDGEENKDITVNGKEVQEIGHSEMIKDNESGNKIDFPAAGTITPPKVKVGNQEVDATFAGWATEKQTLTDGKLDAIEVQLVNADGSLTDAGKTYTFTAKETTLYAVFQGPAEGAATVKYVYVKDENANKLNEKYASIKGSTDGKITGDIKDNVSLTYDESKPAPTFEGYKFTGTIVVDPQDAKYVKEEAGANLPTVYVVYEAEKIADKFKDKLDPETIKVWKGENITWKDGVKLKVANDDLQGILNSLDTQYADATTPARNSSKAQKDPFIGTIKITFKDNSTIEVPKQKLYVSEHKVEEKPGTDITNLPDDKVKVEIKLGEGVKEAKDGGEVGNAANPVVIKTYYVKPNTGLVADDFPTTTGEDAEIVRQANYQNAITWNPSDLTKTFNKGETGSFVASTVKATCKLSEELKAEFEQAANPMFAGVAQRKDAYIGKFDEKTHKVTVAIIDKDAKLTKMSGSGLIVGLTKLYKENKLTKIKISDNDAIDLNAVWKYAKSVLPEADKNNEEKIKASFMGNLKVVIGGHVGNTLKNGEALDLDKDKLGLFIGKSVTLKLTVQEPDCEGNAVELTYTIEGKEAISSILKGKLSPQDIKVWKKDPIDWEKGVKKDETSLTEAQKEQIKDEFSTYEKGVKKTEGKAKFKDATTPARDSQAARIKPYEGNIKVTFSDGSELLVENQKLYVSELMTGKDDNNAPKDAITVTFKLGNGVKAMKGATEIKGAQTPAVYETYKVKPNTNLDNYKLSTNKNIFDNINPQVTDTNKFKNVVWNPTNHVVTKENNTFTANATEAFLMKHEFKLLDKDDNDNEITSLPETITNLLPGDKYVEKGKSYTPDKPMNINAAKEADNKFYDYTFVKWDPTSATNEDKTFKGTWVREQSTSEKPIVDQPKAGDKVINGKGEPGAKITIKVPGKDEPIVIDKVPDDGKWKVDVPELKEGDKIVVIQIEKGKKPSKPVDVTVERKITYFGHFYEPSPDYLNKNVPAKKEKVQEKYLEAYRWYVKGNDMGMFMPKKGITRAEVAQMFARALEYDKAMINVNITPYTDVDANAWYYEAVQKTSAAGIFKGSDKGTFMPTREITKAELIATIARFQHLSTKAGNTLSLQANHWATAEVEAAYQEGWLDIYTNGTAQFAADEVISREEVVTILNRAFGRIADTKYIDDNAHTMTNFPDATKDMWSYYEIMTAANTYLVDKMWVNHATKDNGPETLKEMIEWVKPLIDNKDVREVVEQVKFQR